MCGVKKVRALCFKNLVYLIAEYCLRIGHDFRMLDTDSQIACYKFEAILKFSSLVSLSTTRRS